MSTATGRRDGDGYGGGIPREGRSPGQIDADVALLQEEIRRATAAVDRVADRLDPGYQGALAEVARATRALVDYEARIPLLERNRKRHVDARTARLAGGSLMAVAAFLCLGSVMRWFSAWWIVMIGPLLFAGLWALAGAGQQAGVEGFRRRSGAVAFAFAAAVATLCCTGVVPGWSSPLAWIAALAGLYAFRLLAPGDLPAGSALTGQRQ